jgi:hypothetical protein
MEKRMRTLEEQMQNLSLHRSKDFCLVASITEYGGPRKSKGSIVECFEQIEQYGQISHWRENDIVGITISKLTGEPALFFKGLDQTDKLYHIVG